MLPTSQHPPTPQVRELPDWLDAMVIKELRQAMQQRFFLIPFVAVHFLMLAALWLEWRLLQSVTIGWRAGDSDTGQIIFWSVIHGAVAYLLPLRNFDALQEEKHQGNAELLLMAGLSRWRIVRGKWLVQVYLTLLVLTSMLPYIIVRYFFGAVELSQSVLQFAGLMGCSLANSAILIGASGYSNYLIRLILLIVGGGYVFLATLALNMVSWSLPSMLGAMSTKSFVGIYAGVFCLLCQALYAAMGLQLARAHLRLNVSPGEAPPSRVMASLLMLSPFLIVFGGAATCGWGAGFVVGLMLIGILKYDKAIAVSSGVPTEKKAPSMNPSGY